MTTEQQYNKNEQLYEGKAKKIFSTEDPNVVIHVFKNDATAFNAAKKGQIQDKGQVNAQISATLFPILTEAGVPNHFLGLQGNDCLVTKKVTIIPIEVVVRNIAAGSLAQRLGYNEGEKLREPVVEYYYKDDALGDPLINEDHIRELDLVDPSDLQKIKDMALKTNEVLAPYFSARGIKLVDFKLEFGRTTDGQIILADEISPDTCRFWDSQTNEKLDKDRFRRDLGNVEESYKEVLNRVLSGD